MPWLRRLGAIVVGVVTAVIVAALSFSILVAVWPAYAEAAPTRSFTLAMLLARLGVAVVITVAAACAATLAAGDDGRIAWWLGGLFVVASLPSHLDRMWDVFPIWYHAVYLLGLVPVAGLAARALRVRWPVAASGASTG